mgnify:CR=1 FL=1
MRMATLWVGLARLSGRSVTGEPAHVARASDPLAPLGHAPCVRPRLCVAPQCDAPTTAGSHSDSAGMKVTSIKTTNITP